MMKLGNKVKRLNTKLVCISSSAKHHYDFTIFLNLKTFAESLYNGSLSLEVAKLKQRNMEDMITRLEHIVLLNAIEFYKGRKMILIAFKNNVFPLPKQYPSGNANDWKEDKMDSTHTITEKTDELLPSVKRRKKKD